ncbi:Heme-binding protein [Nitrospira tepida]|uniref:Heme-binding protein n=2 Tax=Nitrospira tepida TaxID=2973512 RepID=A0AA86MVI8_9BACT|nr:Heme-binding protein [Nitrospira tepida]
MENGRSSRQFSRRAVCGFAGVLALSFGFMASVAMAEDLPREAVLPLAMANKAVAAALDKCTKDGYRVSVAVADRAGVLRAFSRGDGAGSHTVESSSKKAYTAASLRGSTGDLAEMLGRMPAVQGLRDMNDKILILGGGLPIEIGGEVVGGIGVGGAPGGHLDAACAQAGLDSIGAAHKLPAQK